MTTSHAHARARPSAGCAMTLETRVRRLEAERHADAVVVALVTIVDEGRGETRVLGSVGIDAPIIPVLNVRLAAEVGGSR
jgi:hypothetical protein